MMIINILVFFKIIRLLWKLNKEDAEYEKDNYGEYHLADIHNFNESEIKEIKYEG